MQAEEEGKKLKIGGMEGREGKDIEKSEGGSMALPVAVAVAVAGEEEGEGRRVMERNGSGFFYEEEDKEMGMREPLLRRRTMNTTSQLAIVGAKVCPIESLDYE